VTSPPYRPPSLSLDSFSLPPCNLSLFIPVTFLPPLIISLPPSLYPIQVAGAARHTYRRPPTHRTLGSSPGAPAAARLLCHAGGGGFGAAVACELEWAPEPADRSRRSLDRFLAQALGPVAAAGGGPGGPWAANWAIFWENSGGGGGGGGGLGDEDGALRGPVRGPEELCEVLAAAAASARPARLHLFPDDGGAISCGGGGGGGFGGGGGGGRGGVSPPRSRDYTALFRPALARASSDWPAGRPAG
jgi:hypothetical protein